MNIIKSFENYTEINRSETIGKNLSAEYWVNKKEGKKPFQIKNHIAYPVDEEKTIPKDTIYMTVEQAEELNDVAENLIKAEEEYKNVMDKF